MSEFPTEALKNAWIAFKFFFFNKKKKAICESAAHPSGNRRTQLTFGFVVSTHQQKNIHFVLFNQYINPHTWNKTHNLIK